MSSTSVGLESNVDARSCRRSSSALVAAVRDTRTAGGQALGSSARHSSQVSMLACAAVCWTRLHSHCSTQRAALGASVAVACRSAGSAAPWRRRRKGGCAGSALLVVTFCTAARPVCQAGVAPRQLETAAEGERENTQTERARSRPPRRLPRRSRCRTGAAGHQESGPRKFSDDLAPNLALRPPQLAPGAPGCRDRPRLTPACARKPCASGSPRSPPPPFRQRRLPPPAHLPPPPLLCLCPCACRKPAASS